MTERLSVRLTGNVMPFGISLMVPSGESGHATKPTKLCRREPRGRKVGGLEPKAMCGGDTKGVLPGSQQCETTSQSDDLRHQVVGAGKAEGAETTLT